VTLILAAYASDLCDLSSEGFAEVVEVLRTVPLLLCFPGKEDEFVTYVLALVDSKGGAGKIWAEIAAKQNEGIRAGEDSEDLIFTLCSIGNQVTFGPQAPHFAETLATYRVELRLLEVLNSKPPMSVSVECFRILAGMAWHEGSEPWLSQFEKEGFLERLAAVVEGMQTKGKDQEVAAVDPLIMAQCVSLRLSWDRHNSLQRFERSPLGEKTAGWVAQAVQQFPHLKRMSLTLQLRAAFSHYTENQDDPDALAAMRQSLEDVVESKALAYDTVLAGRLVTEVQNLRVPCPKRCGWSAPFKLLHLHRDDECTMSKWLVVPTEFKTLQQAIDAAPSVSNRAQKILVSQSITVTAPVKIHKFVRIHGFYDGLLARNSSFSTPAAPQFPATTWITAEGCACLEVVSGGERCEICDLGLRRNGGGEGAVVDFSVGFGMFRHNEVIADEAEACLRTSGDATRPNIQLCRFSGGTRAAIWVCNESGSEIISVHILRSPGHGLFVEERSRVEVSKLSIKSVKGSGMVFMDSNVRIKHSSIAECGEHGIDLVNSWIECDRCSAFSCQHSGLKAQKSDGDIRKMKLSQNKFGIVLADHSRLRVLESAVTESTVAIQVCDTARGSLKRTSILHCETGIEVLKTTGRRPRITMAQNVMDGQTLDDMIAELDEEDGEEEQGEVELENGG